MVHDDFVHRLPSSEDDDRELQKWVAHFQNADKIALYNQDVAREAAGVAHAPLAEDKPMLSPRELILYHKAKRLRTGLQIAEFERQRHGEMLDTVDIERGTWVCAPKEFCCRVGFVLTVTDLVIIQQDGSPGVRLQRRPMSQGYFP